MNAIVERIRRLPRRSVIGFAVVVLALGVLATQLGGDDDVPLRDPDLVSGPFLDQLQHHPGDLWEASHETFRADVPRESLEGTWPALEQQFGALVGYEATMEETELEGVDEVLVLQLQFQDGAADAEVSFADEVLVGLVIEQAVAVE